MSKTLNLLANAKSERDGKYSQIVLKETLKERPVMNVKDSNQKLNIIIFSALVFVLLSNVVFFLLLSGYKSETRSISLKLKSFEKILNGNSDDLGKFSKDLKRIALDFLVINKKIQTSDETLQASTRNTKTNSADIGKLNKEINAFLIRLDALEALNGELEKQKIRRK